MPLNGWQRIGIVASVVWLAVGPFVGSEVADYIANPSMDVKSCVAANERRLGKNAPYAQVYTPCFDEYETNFMRNFERSWWTMGLVAVGPIPIAWLVGWIIFVVSTHRLSRAD